jgi:hypothetical protein
MPIRTLYVRDEDLATWTSAETAAQQAGESLSQLVAAALRNHLASAQPPNGDLRHITVRIGADERASWTEGFLGRWLIAPDNKNRWGPDARVRYGVGITRAGRIAVYRCQVNERWPHTLAFYDHLEDVADAEGWRDTKVIKAIASELGQQHVIWRDV